VPRRRKGAEYRPEIAVLLRDAQATDDEIKREPDAGRRRERRRERDFARDRLLKLCRDAEKRGTFDQLDPMLRLYCRMQKERNAGVLPKPKGGRPTSEHHRLLIAVHVHEAIEARGGTRGSVELALREVAQRYGAAYDHVRDIYYDRDPEWRRAVAAELARRRYEAGQG
jgi:hypothetical protein